MEDAFDPDRPVIIVGGRPTPRHPHSAPSHISKTVPPTIHLGPPNLTKIKNLHAEVQVGGVNDPGWAGCLGPH